MKAINIVVIGIMLFIISGCTTTTLIDENNDNRAVSTAPTSADFQYFAGKMVDSLLASGRLSKPDGGRYVMATGDVVNDTTLRLDTDVITIDIEEAMMNSGQVVMSAAKSGKNAANIDIIMSGKIISRKIQISKKAARYEYYLLLYVTRVEDELIFWQKKQTIVKQGSKKGY
jgi:PBP1b-binding outer membrane lipoprotein LpoB